jgi:hypothetical protein
MVVRVVRRKLKNLVKLDVMNVPLKLWSYFFDFGAHRGQETVRALGRHSKIVFKLCGKTIAPRQAEAFKAYGLLCAAALNCRF